MYLRLLEYNDQIPQDEDDLEHHFSYRLRT